MRETQVLFKHNIHRMIRFHWFLKGNIKVTPTTTEEVLKSHGIEVVDIKEFLNSKRTTEKVALPEEELLNNLPNSKPTPCFTFGNENLPVLGLNQAKQFTNSVEICEGLPEILTVYENKLSLPEEVHLETMRKIKLSCMFEASQEKLPKRINPLKPMWVYPREFGILESKKNELLCKNLITICEQYSDNLKNKSVILDAFFSTPLNAFNKNIQMEMTNELVVTTNKKLEKMAEPSLTHDLHIPRTHSVDCTVGLTSQDIYVMQDIYPPGSNSKWPYIQIALLHFNQTQTKCSTEEEVTVSQIEGRTLLNGFSIAVAEARAVFGSDVKKLPEPIVVPVVQTDGKKFHFAIFQLNTLDLDRHSKVKNIFWSSPGIPLYSVCEYKSGRPVLQGYNPEVIKKLISFYNIE